MLDWKQISLPRKLFQMEPHLLLMLRRAKFKDSARERERGKKYPRQNRLQLLTFRKDAIPLVFVSQLGLSQMYNSPSKGNPPKLCYWCAILQHTACLCASLKKMKSHFERCFIFAFKSHGTFWWGPKREGIRKSRKINDINIHFYHKQAFSNSDWLEAKLDMMQEICGLDLPMFEMH